MVNTAFPGVVGCLGGLGVTYNGPRFLISMLEAKIVNFAKLGNSLDKMQKKKKKS